MLGEEEYASSTDESDEDYNPNANDSDAPSEVESDGEAEDPIHNDTGTDNNTKRLGRKRKAASANESTTKTRRSTAANVSLTQSKKEETKTEDKPLEDDDDDDEDAMWASFLNKSAATAPPQIAKVTQLVAKGQNSNSKQETVTKDKQPTKIETIPVKEPEKKKIVTEIFEFAGEKVEVKKEVKINESDKKATSSSTAADANATQATKRSSGFRPGVGGRTSGGGLSSVLGHIGKKNKLSVLEKTHLDWSGFKEKEGIDEELQTHNKGRDGFLERQDFLERTDLRRFEIEKNMRQTTRRK